MTIAVGAANEFDTLRSVILRTAVPFTANLDPHIEPDPGYRRQLESWSWARYDVALAQQQLDAFARQLESHGIRVLLAATVPGCDSQHYPRDLGFVIDDVFVLGRPRHEIRQWEITGLRPLIERLPRVALLDAGTIEGGDVILHDQSVLVGLGEETSLLGVDSLRYRLETLGIAREVVPIEFDRPGVVHLDTLFNIVAPELALICKNAFSAKRVSWFERHFELIPVTEAETRAVEVNTLSLSKDSVIVKSDSMRVRKALENHGLTTVPIQFSEVTKVPGSFRCATLPLERRNSTS